MALQPVLRHRVRRVRSPGGLAAQVLRRRLRPPLSSAALLTALFIFPASLLRPVGGYLSDRIGARKVMYATFGTMLVASGILMMPYGYIVLQQPGGEARQVMPWTVGVVLFTVLVVIIGCAMGIGKAAVYKHIPEYFPHDVGAVGGLVGSLRGPRWLLPAAAVRLCHRLVRSAAGDVRGPVRHDLDRHAVDARNRGPHAAPGQSRTGGQVREGPTAHRRRKRSRVGRIRRRHARRPSRRHRRARHRQHRREATHDDAGAPGGHAGRAQR